MRSALTACRSSGTPRVVVPPGPDGGRAAAAAAAAAAAPRPRPSASTDACPTEKKIDFFAKLSDRPFHQVLHAPSI